MNGLLVIFLMSMFSSVLASCFGNLGEQTNDSDTEDNRINNKYGDRNVLADIVIIDAIGHRESSSNLAKVFKLIFPFQCAINYTLPYEVCYFRKVFCNYRCKRVQ